jgi:iron(III) transport system substrate-binding protein
VRRTTRATVILAVIVLAATACGPAAPPAITVYSGRSEALTGPLIERFKTETGIDVQVRYGDTAELAALLLEEADNTPADVYFAQDAGALGAVAASGMLAQLPADVLDRVPAAFRSPAGEWVGASGRARVVVYNARELGPGNLPQTIDGFVHPEWRGRIGWAPTNGSFQAFVTAYRLLKGDQTAREWLRGMLANEPRRYEGNAPIVQAVADGEIDVGFVNHYYLLQAQREQDLPFVANHFLRGDDAGALINVAGAGILSASDASDPARRFVEYLLSDESQRYFATETFEYPLVAGVDGPLGVPPLASLQHPDLDLSDLSDLQTTLRMMQEEGVLP